MRSRTLDEIEAIVTRAWCTALSLDRLPSDANVFGLGADSMTAVLIAADLSERLGIDVTLTDLIDAPALTDFVAWVAGVAAQGHGE